MPAARFVDPLLPILLKPAAKTKEVEPPPPEPTDSLCAVALGLRHIEGGGLGYPYGYTTVEGRLYPILPTTNIWPFIDLRGHRFDDNAYAANAGVGVRYSTVNESAIFGFNTYFDYRSNHSHPFTQFGAGVEVLSPALDFRANGYLPFRRRHTIQRCVYDDYVGGYIMIREKKERALRGGDAEIGRVLLTKGAAELYGAVGSYYYRDICRNAVGGKLRANLRLFNILSFDYMMSADSLFGTIIQGQIGLSFNFGGPAKKNPLQKTFTQPVQRNEIIVIDQYCRWKTNF